MKSDKYKKFNKNYSSKSSSTSVPYTVYLNKIRSGIFEPVYILFGCKEGADHPGKDEFISELKSTDKYTVETFQIPENEKLQKEKVNDFLSKAFAPSLWGDKMLLVLKDFQNLTTAKQKEVLDRMITIPKNYFATIVIESKYHSATHKLLNEYNFALMNFYAPDERVLVQYIYEMAKALGLVIDSESAKLLMDLIGADFAAIHQELEKIKTFLGTKTRITTDTVLNSCGFSKESSIEDLIKETFNRNRLMSLSNLYRLQKDRTFPSIIISSLANTALSLLQIKLGANQKMLNLGVKRFEFLVRQSNLWKQEELEKFILTLARIDKKIKTGYHEPYVMLEVLLAKSGKDSEYGRRYVV